MASCQRTIRRASTAILALAVLVVAVPAASVPVCAAASYFAQWAEGSSASTGATRDYFDAAAYLKWRQLSGDWRDAARVLYGGEPYAAVDVADLDMEQTVTWDVTTLVREWLDGTQPNTGFFLKASGGKIDFYSREHDGGSKAPVLRLSYSDSADVEVNPVADTYLTTSTYKAQGTSGVLKSGSILIRFDSAAMGKAGSLVEAELALVTTAKQYGSANIGIFRPAPEYVVAPPGPEPGIADDHRGDLDIGNDPDVIFAEDFEAEAWADNWTDSFQFGNYERIARDPEQKFEALSGHALRVTIKQGVSSGSAFRYKFLNETGEEPEEAYFRYYLRLAENWKPTVQGGKLPGLAGTYNKAGWGGRKSNGTNGWSMRGHFKLTIDESSPLAGKHPVGTYAYYADMPGFYGDQWMWNNGILENNRWYCIEQHVKMNTVGKSDGVFQAWIDGKLVYENTAMQYRTVPDLKIESVWMDVYHGGTAPAPQDYTLYIDNVVVARKYIGPIRE